VDVPGLMRQSVDLHRDRPAVLTEHGRYTFAEMWDRGVRTANALIAAGVRPGDRVAGRALGGIHRSDPTIRTR